MLRKLSFITLLTIISLNVFSIDIRNLSKNEALETNKIDSLLNILKDKGENFGSRIVLAAKSFEGMPEDDYYKTDSVANLRLNLESFTPLMFVNNAIALAKTASTPGVADWRTFASELERVACRRGEDKGYAHLMYHAADWIGDNSSRGVVKELTEDYNGVEVRTKSLDDMTRNRKHFAALADSAVFESVRMVEMGFRTHRIPTLKRETIKRKDITDDLRNGDVVILVPNGEGHDIYDIGVIEIADDGPHLIHVSPQTHRVVREQEPLARYMGLLTKYFKGYRIVRPLE